MTSQEKEGCVAVDRINVQSTIKACLRELYIGTETERYRAAGILEGILAVWDRVPKNGQPYPYLPKVVRWGPFVVHRTETYLEYIKRLAIDLLYDLRNHHDLNFVNH